MLAVIVVIIFSIVMLTIVIVFAIVILAIIILAVVVLAVSMVSEYDRCQCIFASFDLDGHRTGAGFAVSCSYDVLAGFNDLDEEATVFIGADVLSCRLGADQGISGKWRSVHALAKT